jgi:hypothetical protein
VASVAYFSRLTADRLTASDQFQTLIPYLHPSGLGPPEPAIKQWADASALHLNYWEALERSPEGRRAADLGVGAKPTRILINSGTI